MIPGRKLIDDHKGRQHDLLNEVQSSFETITQSFKNQKNSKSFIPKIILEGLDVKRRIIQSHSRQKDRMSWPIQPSTQKYGAWFEGAPLEILPEFPSASPTASVIKELKIAIESAIIDIQFDTSIFFSHIFNEEAYYKANKTDRLHRLWLGLYFLSLDSNPWSRDSLYTQSYQVHENSTVRSLVLSLAYFDLPWVPAEEYVYDCTHDTDEGVFIKAFRICGRLHDERAMDHLRPIVRSPSAVLKGIMNNKMYYPVGHAACNICPAQFAIIGTDDPNLANVREQELLNRNRSPLSAPVEHARIRLAEAIEAFKPPDKPKRKPADLDNMILIPSGKFAFGVQESEVNDEVFNWETCYPPQRVNLDAFYIDPYPVTNKEYDQWEREFSALKVKERRRFEHPGQVAGKPHRRNTFDDTRFGSDHPVVGIDWFDAWAYSRYHNKELPTEQQWEKAARADTAWRYPWGNEFDPRALSFANKTYNTNINNLIDWIILLNNGTQSFPPTTTCSVFAHPTGQSPYGVFDMCGNAWEFTKTSFYTGNDARLPFADFSPIELMGSHEGHVVIRGGAWSSPSPLIGAAYRGYDLLTDRHTEIGFRCVSNL